MKCDICSATIDTVFLGKPRGTYVKDAKGKKYLACFACQKKLGTKEKLLASLAKP